MYLKHQKTGDLVEVLDLGDLFDPFHAEIKGRYHSGEELQDEIRFSKSDLIFPSGEGLPQCWTDGKYRERTVG
jgi:hypothetical protein